MSMNLDLPTTTNEFDKMNVALTKLKDATQMVEGGHQERWKIYMEFPRQEVKDLNISVRLVQIHQG